MLTFPSFYDSKKVGTLFYTRNQKVAAEASQYARDNAVKPARGDENPNRVLLILVDEQIDFIHEKGHLSVPGAIEDTRRINEWIFRNLEKITMVSASLDTHVPIQIFSPGYWYDRETGTNPAPMTMITADLFRNRYDPKFIPHPSAVGGIKDWNKYYIDTLNANSQKELMLWTYHCLTGTPGFSLDPSLAETILFWSIAREQNPFFLSKGTSFWAEHYSILEAEVPVPTDPGTQINVNFLDSMNEFDKVYIAGQAKSHCVLETIRTIVNHFQDHASHMLSKMYLLMDAMSSVQHPDIDFEAICQTDYAQWQTMGVNLVTTQDSVDTI